MKARVISVNNQQGGVGKTTTALAMAAILAEEKRVLLIDCDGSSTTLTKILCQQAELDYRQLKMTLTDLILFKTLGRDTDAFADGAVIHCPEGYDLLPADNKLVSVAAALATQNDMEIRFKALSHLVEYYRRYYDFIILDAAPVLDLFATNQLVAADELLVVSQCQKASREAIHELLHTVDNFVRPINKALTVKGILLTMLDKRAKYGKQQIEEMRDEFEALHIFDAVIPRATEAERYVDSGRSIIYQFPRGNVAQGYREFMQEFLVERLVE